ncbi:MAG: response regulator, partial [Clostridia bacterium]|nr:response regulator [Clostridia bacterium]
MYKILVVDDEENIRRLIKKYAEFEGHTVDEAKDGMEAIKMTRDGEYDLLVVDIMMPELDGFSACREIRKFSSV